MSKFSAKWNDTTICGASTSNWNNSPIWINENNSGQTFWLTPKRSIFGANWNNAAAKCGTMASNWNNSPLNLNSNNSGHLHRYGDYVILKPHK